MKVKRISPLLVLMIVVLAAGGAIAAIRYVKTMPGNISLENTGNIFKIALWQDEATTIEMTSFEWSATYIGDDPSQGAVTTDWIEVYLTAPNKETQNFYVYVSSEPANGEVDFEYWSDSEPIWSSVKTHIPVNNLILDTPRLFRIRMINIDPLAPITTTQILFECEPDT